MHLRRLKYLTVLILCLGQASIAQESVDPFAFFQPSLTLTASERAQLGSGSPFARVLQTKGLEVAVFAVAPVSVDGDRLVAWEQQIEEFKKSSYVLSIGRFSDPPRIEDLANLELDSGDVAAIRSCRPGSCALKLSAAEMTQLKRSVEHAKGDQESSVQQAFRAVVLNRVRQYLANGQIPPEEDHHEQVERSSQFAMLLDHTPFLTNGLPQFAKKVRDYPGSRDPGVESFLYWSKERSARKAIISVTHINIVRPHSAGLPDTLIVGRDIFSTHYVNASLSVMALMPGSNHTNYLVYLNRTEVDVLDSMFGGMIRRSIERHLKNAANFLSDMRQRLESGDPPGESQPASLSPPQKPSSPTRGPQKRS